MSQLTRQVIFLPPIEPTLTIVPLGVPVKVISILYAAKLIIAIINNKMRLRRNILFSKKFAVCILVLFYTIDFAMSLKQAAYKYLFLRASYARSLSVFRNKQVLIIGVKCVLMKPIAPIKNFNFYI